ELLRNDLAEQLRRGGEARRIEILIPKDQHRAIGKIPVQPRLGRLVERLAEIDADNLRADEVRQASTLHVHQNGSFEKACRGGSVTQRLAGISSPAASRRRAIVKQCLKPILAVFDGIQCY